MTASFGPGLVFDMDAGHASGLESLHRAPCIKRVAVSIVCIDNDRNIYTFCNITCIINHLFHRKQADVWVSAANRCASAGDNAKPKTYLFNQLCGHRIVCTASKNETILCQECTKFCSSFHDYGFKGFSPPGTSTSKLFNTEPIRP